MHKNEFNDHLRIGITFGFLKSHCNTYISENGKLSINLFMSVMVVVVDATCGSLYLWYLEIK